MSPQLYLALSGSVARIIFPILAVYFESYIKYSAAFAGILICTSVSVVLIVVYRNQIDFYTRAGGRQKNSSISLLGKLIITAASLSVFTALICLILVAWE